ncbi:MoaD/ThiS family protein [Pyxidicoccus sp. MSG2]|uniref:MoaD/ThiS family protein n=1 Tax=Pyxidicoccus sp. MSG2 TaxID=2996790 RepID=UPI002271D7F7|nr:MoaD/ThiS family protein [Pyxidicoccus sp. MSG2]MCY1021097.1 MoaD/ThiS family protein [Pyxidicoccus sp. MSG2]
MREALEPYFAGHPLVRSYVLDEQGALRRHVVIFVNGHQLRDRAGQTMLVGEDFEIHVMQALSGC